MSSPLSDVGLSKLKFATACLKYHMAPTLLCCIPDCHSLKLLFPASNSLYPFVSLCLESFFCSPMGTSCQQWVLHVSKNKLVRCSCFATVCRELLDLKPLSS